jgi:hypothetical protein
MSISEIINSIHLQGLGGVIKLDLLTRRAHNGMEMIGTDSFLQPGQELLKRLLVITIVGQDFLDGCKDRILPV